MKGLEIEMRSIRINDIFHQFAELLNDRFFKNIYSTEDSIRYTLFYCLTQAEEIHPSDIILEYPHPRIPGARIDTYIPPTDKRNGLVFETKFDREIPSRKNSPRTQKAGRVFADIIRLAHFSHENVQRYFIYITDKEMAVYFQNRANRLDDFFNLNQKDTLSLNRSYIENHNRTFIATAGKRIIDCEVVSIPSRNIRDEIWIRIHEIKV